MTPDEARSLTLDSFLWKRWRQIARKADIKAYDAAREQEEHP